MEIPTPTPSKAQEIVRRLMSEKGLTAHQIASEMEDRVSWRTIYRWAKGEHAPQQPADMTALQKVADRHLSESSDTPL
jgi:predicted DNA-binding transcriptional regulator YafY